MKHFYSIRKVCLLISFLFPVLAFGQITVKGLISSSEDNQSIPGVSIIIKNTTKGTISDKEGRFSLPVNVGETLVFSSIGFVSQEFKVNNENPIKITLKARAQQLKDVIVTGALGIKRQSKELGFAATTVSAKKLTEAHPTNFTNGLTGKVAGLVVSTVDNGINPATRFTLRGNRHITGNNFALVVLNGVPISPNEVGAINPDDIADVNVLNGPGAAALYGSEASNGAIIVTTKKGSTSISPEWKYSNTYQIEQLSYFPALQTEFGGFADDGKQYVNPITGAVTSQVPYENQSYGPRYDGSTQPLGFPDTINGFQQKFTYATPKVDPRRAFFVTGTNDINNLSYAVGDPTNSFNFSANYLTKTGIVPNDTYNRITTRFSVVRTVGKFRTEVNAGYTHSHTSTYGRGYDFPGLDGGNSLLFQLLNTPSWVPLQNYKNINATFANPSTYFNAYSINPYWIVNESRYNTYGDNFNGDFYGTYSPTNWLEASYRLATNFGIGRRVFTRAQVNFNAYSNTRAAKLGYTTYANANESRNGLPASIPGQTENFTQFGDGSIGIDNAGVGANGFNRLQEDLGGGPQGFSRAQQDITLNFHRQINKDLKWNLLLGNTIWQEYLDASGNSSTNLTINGFYNIGTSGLGATTFEQTAKIRQIGFFGDFNISFKDYAFLEFTFRNDKDSRLPIGGQSFFYPSIKGSLILTDALPFLKDNDILDYAKIRASYSKVGEVTVGPYSIVNKYLQPNGFPYAKSNALSRSTTLNNYNLKPEFTNEIETGLELGFFDSRITTEFSYYLNHTINQTIAADVSPITGYSNQLQNIGDVLNRGFEFTLDVNVLEKGARKLGIDLSGNFAIQESKVISLSPTVNSVILDDTYPEGAVEAVVGSAYPVLFVSDVLRDPQGRVIVDSKTGDPIANPNLVNFGQTTPKYILGLTQEFSYGIASLTIVSDFRAGNVVYNQGLNTATFAGASALSAYNGRKPFVFPNSVIQTPTGYIPNTNLTTSNGNYNFWVNGAYSQAGSTFVTSGTFWKLREASLNFDLTKWAKKTKLIKKASFAIVGRNLILWRPKSNNWTDPEFSNSPSNSVGVSDDDQLFPTRIFGASLNITF